LEKYFCPRELREIACRQKPEKSSKQPRGRPKKSQDDESTVKTTKGSRAVKKKELEATVMCVDEGDGSVATDAQQERTGILLFAILPWFWCGRSRRVKYLHITILQKFTDNTGKHISRSQRTTRGDF